MSTDSDRVTRLSATLVTDAAEAGRREQRSARQQLEHWARVGRSVSQRSTVARHRVERALLGALSPESLTDEESIVYDAEIDSRIEERLPGDDHVARRRANGFASVAVDESGNIVEFRPDGTTVVLDP